MNVVGSGRGPSPTRTRASGPLVPPCESSTLVRATAGVVSVTFWDFGVALTGEGGGGGCT